MAAGEEGLWLLRAPNIPVPPFPLSAQSGRSEDLNKSEQTAPMGAATAASVGRRAKGSRPLCRRRDLHPSHARRLLLAVF